MRRHVLALTLLLSMENSIWDISVEERSMSTIGYCLPSLAPKYKIGELGEQ